MILRELLFSNNPSIIKKYKKLKCNYRSSMNTSPSSSNYLQIYCKICRIRTTTISISITSSWINWSSRYQIKTMEIIIIAAVVWIEVSQISQIMSHLLSNHHRLAQSIIINNNNYEFDFIILVKMYRLIN